MEKVWGGRSKEDTDGEGKRLVLGRGLVKNLVLRKRRKKEQGVPSRGERGDSHLHV